MAEGETKRDTARTPPGPAVDAAGAPVKDPSPNVLDLVEAANQRQNDLREQESAHFREIIALRADCQKDEISALQDVERLRADHAKELRIAEAARIDAIRAVDVGAVQQAAQVQSTAAQTLAAQVSTSAETLRTQVAAAASAATIALAAALEPVQKDIADLRRAQYEAQGVKAQSTESGGIGRAWIGIAVAAASVLVAVLMIVVVIAVATHGFTK